MTQLKKITHLNFARGYRGGERQTILLIQELAKRGHQQQLFTRIDSELAQSCTDIPNLKIIKIAKPYIFSLAKFKDAEILHAHETKGAQVAFLVNKFLNTPYIITRRVDNKIKDNAFTRAMYANANYCVAISSVIKKVIFNNNPRTNITLIPDAQTDFNIDETKVAQLRERFAGKYLVGNIGELENKQKGQLYLIEAIKRIATEHKNIHFIFLGRGKDADSYRQQTQHLNNVSFEGFVDNVGDYISCFDLFVFPSLNEGLGSILLDVIKLKVPVIASDVGGIPDIVKHNQTGILVAPKDSDAIYKNIINLYQHSEVATQLSESAYQNAFKYRPAVMADNYLQLYNNL